MEYNIHIIDSIGMVDPTPPADEAAPANMMKALDAMWEQMDQSARAQMLREASSMKDSNDA